MLTSGTVNVTTGGDANAKMQQRFIKAIATHQDFNNGDITQIDDSSKGFDATYLYDGKSFPADVKKGRYTNIHAYIQMYVHTCIHTYINS